MTGAGPAHARCGCNASARTRTKTPAAPAGPRLQISAVAFDRDDRPVADLRASDMEVWIGGFRVPIETLTVIDSSTAGRPGRDRAPARRHDAATGPHPRGQGDRSAFRRSPGARRRNGRGSAQRQRDGEHGRPQRPLTEHRSGWPAAGHWRSACGRRWAHVLKTVAVLSHQLLEPPGGRKTIVGIGPASLFDTPIPNPDRQPGPAA